MSGRFINHLPHTEFGASLCLTEEQERVCRVVYRLSEDEPDLYVFDSLWNPNAVYSDKHIIVPLRSTAVKKIQKTCGYIFSNLIGSSSDVNPEEGSWLDVFRKHHIACNKCMTDGNFYNPDNDRPFATKRDEGALSCSCHMVGGHVYEGKINKSFNREDCQTVELIPICSHHNTYSLGNGNGTGTGFYMKLKENTYIIQLIGYLNEADVHSKQSV